ncbi:MAG: peptidylprolyl isomerase [Acidimicrobiaceae bacterium]|nr:peptidylprolyl isomerase [Acidimicrobiaceae bacterium]
MPDSSPTSVLEIEDIVIGDGPEVATGDYLIMDYVGVSYSTGLQFDASWDRGQPFPFELGAGRVIKGWDEGIPGMAVGGRRTLTIPPEMAYGESGSGSGSIGPNETLVFTVDLLAAVPQNLLKPNVDVPNMPSEELFSVDNLLGQGKKVTLGSVVYIHYVGVSQSTGEQFDSSWDRGRSEFIGYISGSGNVIDGLDQGMLGMQVGGRRTIVIPPNLAYGANGAGDGLIAPNETLIFTVDLLGVHPLR